MFKIADPPENLGDLSCQLAQRQDHVIVSLREGGPMPGEIFPTFPVGVEWIVNLGGFSATQEGASVRS